MSTTKLTKRVGSYISTLYFCNELKMQVKLHKPIEGKFGTYLADTWLEAKNIDGFIFVSSESSPNMRLKRVARTNIKEIKE